MSIIFEIAIAVFLLALFFAVVAKKRSKAGGHYRKRDFRKYQDYRHQKKSFESSEVVYREESESFEERAHLKKAKGMDLADDPHGVFGEAATSAIVARVAHDDHCHHFLLQNVYIPTHSGYTEIDTVLLHETGIYVFETKNVSGVVTGELEDRQWKLRMNERTVHDLYNPISQNHGHIGALMRVLGTSFKTVPVYSVIVFSDRCVLKRVPGKGFRFQVLHFGELKEALKTYFARGARRHGREQLEKWNAFLKPCTNRGEKTKMMHRVNVQKMHEN